MSRFSCVLSAFLSVAFVAAAQVAPARSTPPPPGPPPTQTARPDSLTGPASMSYQRGAIGRFLFGSHHRATWEMPVTAPAFRPDQLMGGLRTVKEGGSMQTLNLRMVDPQGHQYVLRSVDKDLRRALPARKRQGLKADVLQDQTAAVHPYGALVASSLADAAGIYHATPRLFRVPSDENVLGEFQQDFAGKLVFLEERPDGNWEGQKVFGSSNQVVSSERMLQERYAVASHLPDARRYLRARLFDLYVGDWSRREDQWRWALHKAAPDALPDYVAVPRDRDHAFSRYSDGLLPGIATLFEPKVVSFGPKIGNVKRYVKTSETLDRVLLGWLTEADFKAEAEALQSALTDAALDRALTQWPTNVQRLDGRKFRQDLQTRRQELPAAARSLYRYLAQDVLLPASDTTDVFTLSPGPNGGLTVTWTNPSQPKTGTRQRTFSPKETKHVRIYALNGADRLELTAKLPKSGPQVEFFDGPGQDVAKRADGVETPRWLHLRASGDPNDFDALPEWCRKPAKNVSARDYDAAGFLLRHRLD